MKLYGNLNSPFVRACMIVAIEVGLSSKVQLKTLTLDPSKANEDLEKLSPIAKMPILETDHGHALFDSRVIMEYFCHAAGNKSLLPDEGNKHFHVLTLVALAQGMCDAALILRYETALRPKELLWAEYAERQSKRIATCIATLEAKWLNELADVNLGSIATACGLAYLDLRNVAPGWRDKHKHLANWLDDFTKRQSFQNTLPPG